jgi:membrane-associated phospholipid phosphatase
MAKAPGWIILLLLARPALFGQARPEPPASAQEASPVARFAKDVWKDQKRFVAAPFRMNRRQFFGVFVPLAAGTAALTFADPAAGRYTAGNPNVRHVSRVISQAGAPYTLATLASLTVVGGKATGKPHVTAMGRNGLLALTDAAIATYALKYSLARERPYHNDGAGRFFKGKDGFPSGHATLTFAVATAVARSPRCPRWVALASYGVASAASVSRWGVHKHFPSDVVAGAALGFLIGNSVAGHHR